VGADSRRHNLDDLDDRLYRADAERAHFHGTQHRVTASASRRRRHEGRVPLVRDQRLDPVRHLRSPAPSSTKCQQPAFVLDSERGRSRQGVLASAAPLRAPPTRRTPGTPRAHPRAPGTRWRPDRVHSPPGSYSPPFNRWGDYSLTRVDPGDGNGRSGRSRSTSPPPTSGGRASPSCERRRRRRLRRERRRGAGLRARR
jgi:hypothetical protein